MPITIHMVTCFLAHFRCSRAFICNYRDHWLTVRKLGNQWFNLNSLLSGPELISHTYLAMFLTQLQVEGKFKNKSDCHIIQGDNITKFVL